MRVVRHSKPVAGIREPDTGQRTASVYGFVSAPNEINSPVTHRRPSGAAGVATRAEERRAYVRVRLSLPLRVQRVAGQRNANTRALQTLDISSSGVYFLSPDRIEPGTPIELELVVVDRPLGPGSVRMRTEAHVVRADDAAKPGWHGVAAAFDDIRFLRDEPLPPRFRAD